MGTHDDSRMAAKSNINPDLNKKFGALFIINYSLVCSGLIPVSFQRSAKVKKNLKLSLH